MKSLKSLSAVWNVPELRKKLVFTAFALVVFRLVAHIPASGIDREALRTLFLQSPFLSLLDIFSGGTLANFSVLALGVNPYISASIILQLLMFVFPTLKETAKEGEAGRAKINQYTRLATIPLAIVQAVSMYFLLNSQAVISALPVVSIVVLVITMVAGTMFAVWLGELITEYGVGNGISLLIFAGIVGQFPVTFGKLFSTGSQEDIFPTAIMAGILLLVVASVVFMNEAARRIPLHYARSLARGGVVAQQTYLPLRVSQGGVWPIIFALYLAVAPASIGQLFSKFPNEKIAYFASSLAAWANPASVAYNVVLFILVFAFTFFTTVLFFNPTEVADDIKKHGGFIPGVRPGANTASYLNFVLTRVNVAGAFFLGTLAVLPSLAQSITSVSALAVGGTGILIVVSVVLETIKKLESQLVARSYEKFTNL